MSKASKDEKTAAPTPVAATSLSTGAAAAAAGGRISRVSQYSTEEEPDSPVLADSSDSDTGPRIEHHTHLLAAYHSSPYKDAKTIYCDHCGGQIDVTSLSVSSNPIFHCNVCGEYDECDTCYNRAAQMAQFRQLLWDIAAYTVYETDLPREGTELMEYYAVELKKFQCQPYDIGSVIPYDSSLKGVIETVVFPRTVTMKVDGVKRAEPVLVLASRPNHPLTQPEAAQRRIEILYHSAMLQFEQKQQETTGWLTNVKRSLYLQFVILVKLAAEAEGEEDRPSDDPLLDLVADELAEGKRDSLPLPLYQILSRIATFAFAGAVGNDRKKTVPQLRKSLLAIETKTNKLLSALNKSDRLDDKLDDEEKLINRYFKYLPPTVAPAIPSDAHPVTVLDPVDVPIASASAAAAAAPSASAAAEVAETSDEPEVELDDKDASDDATVQPEKADEDGPDGKDSDDDLEGDSETEADAANAALDELPEYKRKAIADANLGAGKSELFKDTLSQLARDYAVNDEDWKAMTDEMQFRSTDDLISETREERRQYDLKRKAIAEHGFDTSAMSHPLPLPQPPILKRSRVR